MVSIDGANTIKYSEGIKMLQNMFPTLELEIIKSVLEYNNNQVESSIDYLLQITSNQFQVENDFSNKDKYDDQPISIFNSTEQKIIEKNLNSTNTNINTNKNSIPQDKSQDKHKQESQISTPNKINKVSLTEKMKNFVGGIFGKKKEKKGIAATVTDLKSKDKSNKENEQYMRISNKEDD